MKISERRLLDARLRQNLLAFVQLVFSTVSPGNRLHLNWHLLAICYQLERIWRGEIKRLIIEVPPRSLKSICASVAFPAFLLGHDPKKRIITASYSADLAAKHANDTRAVMKMPWYQSLFPDTRISDEKDTEHEFRTTQRGGRFSTSVGGTITGRGASIIIIDDALKPQEALSEAARTKANDWYDGTVFSRLDDKSTDAIVIVMQRLHQDDLSGHVQTLEDWEVLSLPAVADEDQEISIGNGEIYHRARGELLDPVREPQHVLDTLRATLGHYHFSAQYQQNPIPVDGEVVKYSWFKRFKEIENKRGLIRVQSWDTASKPGELNDYSVCTTWMVDDSNFYLLDVLRQRMDFPSLRQTVIRHAIAWKANEIIIEDKGSGTQLLQQIRSERRVDIPRPIAFTPQEDKLVRMAAQSTRIEAGQVFIPEEGPWLAEFRAEFAQFPNGRYDDQVDSVSQFLAWISNYLNRQPGVQRVPMFGSKKPPRPPHLWKWD